MVAKISFPKRLLGALNYNEKKVQKGLGTCLAALNYLSEAKDLTFHQKHQLLERQGALNERAQQKTIHISLNFDPSEQLNVAKLRAIATRYLQLIGFDNQPGLVYEHRDAGHPHVHIVSSLIRADGSRIRTHNLGKTLSEKARQQVEREFGLVVAKGKRRELSDVPAKSVTAGYGQEPTQVQLSRIVQRVLHTYLFTTIPEFNAALKTFRVEADLGKAGGRMQQHGGLRYHLLDGSGNKIGVPMKASKLAGQPILARLQEKMQQHGEQKDKQLPTLRARIDKALHTPPANLEMFKENLAAAGIDLITRSASTGQVYGLTYVDHQLRLVANGSELGKGYSAKGMLARLQTDPNSAHPSSISSNGDPKTVVQTKPSNDKKVSLTVFDVLHALVQPTGMPEITPLHKKRKRKKRKPRL